MNISAVVCTWHKNTKDEILRLIDSLKDCSEVIFYDDGSSKEIIDTAKLLKVIVVERTDKYSIPTLKNTDDFKAVFGYYPKFRIGEKLRNMGTIRNKALDYASNDWVFFPDADEIVSWDFNEIKKLLPLYDQIECRLVQSREPYRYNNITKLFRKSKNKWVGHCHEVVSKNNVRSVYTDKMKIDHYQRPNGQSDVLPLLEYSVLKDNDTRSMFYLGREYYYYKRYDKAIGMLDRYIPISLWIPEKAEAYYFKALCLWQIQRGDEARKACYEAVHLNPDMKKALLLASEMHYEPWKSKWKFIADNAGNNDVIFPY